MFVDSMRQHDAGSGGGLLHLRFSTALFAALAGERRATRYHPCTDPSVVGSGQPKVGFRSPWPEIKAMMMLMMVMRMLVMMTMTCLAQMAEAFQSDSSASVESYA